MRVTVVGATGNVGLALVRRLADDSRVEHVVGVARRVHPHPALAGVEWVEADIVTDDLVPLFRGADAVVHLAWLIQPSRDLAALWRVNVDGSERVLQAVAAAGVDSLVYASSVGAYSPGRGDTPVDESWPTHGIADSSYSRQKAYVERMLDIFELRHGDVRVVRLRPGLIFQEQAAEEQRRFFAGMLLPRALLRPGVLPIVPHLAGARFQAVHAEDVAEAYRLSLLTDVRGAFNVAADPVLSTRDVAELLDARTVPVPGSVARVAVAATWRSRLHPVSPGWVSLGLRSPVMDTARARAELGWSPAYDAREAVAAVLRGMRRGSGGPTPTLAPGRSTDEVRTGHGQRSSPDERVTSDRDDERVRPG